MIPEIIIPSTLRQLNQQRCDKWHDSPTDTWTLGDWGNALAGEVGELCNIVKKIRRHEAETSLKYNTPEREQLSEMFTEEVADVLLYLDLLCWKAGVTPTELIKALQKKFNTVSVANDWHDLLWWIA